MSQHDASAGKLHRILPSLLSCSCAENLLRTKRRNQLVPLVNQAGRYHFLSVSRSPPDRNSLLSRDTGSWITDNRDSIYPHLYLRPARLLLLLLKLAASGALPKLSAEHAQCLFIFAGLASRNKSVREWRHGLSSGSVESLDAAVMTVDIWC